MENKQEIVYKSDFIELLNDISRIVPKIIIEKMQEKIVVYSKNDDQTVIVNLEVSPDYFDLPIDHVAFYNFQEFYKFYKCFVDPKFYVDDTTIYITDSTSTIEYKLTDRNTIPTANYGKRFTRNNPDVRLLISKMDIDNIAKISSSLNAKFIKFYGSKDELYIKIITNEVDNTYNKRLDMENVSGFTEDFNFDIYVDVFKQISTKKNYKVELFESKFVTVEYLNEDVKLLYITTKVISKFQK